MDTSEAPPYDDGMDSPTQVNEGRSYDQYEDPPSLPSNSLRATQEQDAGHDFLNRSLDENESGAVKFGSVHSMELDFESPTASNEDERRRPNAFFPNSDNDPATTTNMGFNTNLGPETPAPPKNPFGGKFQTPLVAGSQLFAATPFSAAFNQASPTSSRPSPSELIQQPVMTTPYTDTASATKLRFSNLGEQTPMPAVLFHALSTSSTSRFDSTTPYPNKSSGSPAISAAQSSPTRRRRRTPAPMTEYESMRKSQERREAAAEARSSDLADGFGSSSDEEDADVRRQRIVRQKKEEATRILATVSMSGPTFREDIVEVPASVKREVRSRSQKAVPGSGALEICPESDPPVVTGREGAAAETAMEGPVNASSGLRSSEYDVSSFPQSIIDRPTPEILPATKTPSSSAALPQMPEVGASQGQPLVIESSLNGTEAIPETSPAGKWPLNLTASREIVPSTSDAVEEPVAPTSSMPEPELPPPPPPRELSSSPIYSQTKRVKQAEEVVSLIKQVVPQDHVVDITTSSPPVPASSSNTVQPPQRKRARYGSDSERKQSGRNSGRNSGRASLAASVSSMDRSASSLSDLSATPTQRSREGTPITANDSDLSTRGSKSKLRYTSGIAKFAAANESHSGGDDDNDDDDDDLPLIPKRRLRRGESPSLSLPDIKPKLEHSSAKSSRSVKPEPSPIPSGSTDELSASPAMLAALLAPGQNTRSTRKSARSMGTKAKPSALTTSLRSRTSGAPGLFAGMVFDVSLASKEGSDKQKKQTILEMQIQKAGGRILPGGFEEMFRQPPTATNPTGTSSRTRATLDTANHIGKSELQLLPKEADSGFTALIIEGHSRKAKYLEALALGLPCLSPRWATTCLDKGELVDWSPYLLCAGESSYLGGAIRSRNLIPYDASTARLADVVEQRKLILDGLSILFIKGERTDTPMFLAHVLGARLSLAQNVTDARERLIAMEDTGRPCDWVFPNQNKDITGIFEDRVKPAVKKRKRQSSDDNDSERVPLPVKELSLERLIQSLIFGQLIEDADF